MRTRFARRDVENMAAQNSFLADIKRLEPEAFRSIVNQALALPDGTEPWPCYTILKQQTKRVVGQNATHPELRTSHHYDALIDLIEHMLPVDTEQDRVDEFHRGVLAAQQGEGSQTLDLAAFVQGVREQFNGRNGEEE